MKTVVILFLLAFAEVLVSVDSTFDPSEWNFASDTHFDSVDVVDPSGWNYDRDTKSSVRDTEEDRKKQTLEFSQGVMEKNDIESNTVVKNEEELPVSSSVVEEDIKSYTVVKNEEELPVSSSVVEEDIKSNIVVEKEMEFTVGSRVANIFNNKATDRGNIAFIRRFISILLESANLSSKYSEGGPDVSGVIEIIVSNEHLKTLLHFSNSSANISMRELDSILSVSIHGKYIPPFDLSELIDKIFFMASQKEVWLPFILFCIMVYAFHLIMIGSSRTKFLTSIVLLIFTFSYLVEYYKMYKEVEIKQKMTLDKYQDLPKSCYENENLWSYFLKAFTFNKEDKECMDYHKALLLDPLVEVSPSLVLSNILSGFILNPFSKAGDAVADFANSILGKLPITYGWIVWLSSSVGFFLFLVFAFVIFIGGSIQFRGLFSGVSISSTGASTTTPALASPIDTRVPLVSSGSQPLFEAVSGMSNFVLMDANSLGTLVLRAQSSVTALPSGVEELTPPADKLPLRSSNEKIDFSKLQKERLLAGVVEDKSVLSPVHKSSQGEQEILSEDVSKAEQVELESDISNVKEELLLSFEVIQSDATVLESTTMETDVSKKTPANSITKCEKSDIEQ